MGAVCVLLNSWWVPDEVQFDIYLKNVKLIQNLIEKYLKI